ncbi:MAG: Asp-tRNA(Asn)/Glu-tRNA(Gln) amidotransferase subunit GatB [Roseiflexaceae bacterium]|nr:Asp-tRNA(Asn)/Glu-tRNA(Gln) amidotransferase subunit GatB [Chloroflexaceae bacterium]
MKYVATIGLEVHAQIRTTSKMFCGCRTDASQAMPNTNVCPVCLGLPGALPVPNRQAIEMAAMTGLALHSTITRDSVISRKNYFYPDLPSSYQRSQYEDPLCVGGYVEFPTADGMRRIELTRIHIEEDTGKLTHMPDGSSLIDYNRAGVPLMEIVSEPVIASAEEARLYFQTLHQLLSWIGVNSGNLEEGALRCDANVSVRPEGQKEFGAKVEIKNVNSFRNVERAINYEIERQIDVLTNGGRIIQSTRGWNDATGKTVEQRTKEFAHDYRYFPDPDIPPLQMESAYVQSIGARLPELPIARYQRFMMQYALSAKDAESLTITREVADFYEATVTASVAVGGSARDASVWIIGEFFRLLNDRGERIADASARMTPQHIAGVIALLSKGTITRASAKEVFEECYNNGTMPDAVVATRGLAVIGDSDALLKMARDAVAANPKAVADYKAGKDASIKFLVGQIMKVSRGQASPQAAEAALVTALSEV